MAKAIVGKATSAKQLRRLKSGDFIAELENQQAIDTLLSTTSMARVEVSITPHRTLNYVKGVVYSSLLKDCSDEEILEEVNDQRVTHVRCIMRKVNGQLKPLDMIAMTFSATEHLRKCFWTTHRFMRGHLFPGHSDAFAARL